MQQTTSGQTSELSLDLLTFFNSSIGNSLILKPNPPHYTILAVNDDHLRLTGLKREDVVGRGVFEVFPDNEASTASTGPILLKESLDKVLATKTENQMPVIRYDVSNQSDQFEERYWLVKNRPVLDADGNVRFILHANTEVTEQEKARKKAIALRDLEKQYSLFLQAPVAVCIFSGPDYIIELANEEALTILEATPDLIGKPFLEAVPESEQGNLSALLSHVRTTGESYHGTEFPIHSVKEGETTTRYFNFTYQPYYEGRDKTLASGVFCVSHEVTEQVLARKKVEESELQIRTIIESSQHPIGVYTGREMRIRFANQALKDSLGKGNDIVGKTYKDVLPELENQQTFELLDRVFTAGVPFQARNHKMDLVINGKLRTHYFDLSFAPLRDTAGEVYGIVNTGADVTNLYLAHQNIKDNEARYRTLIEEAPVATALYMGPELTIQYSNTTMLSLLEADSSVLGKPFGEAMVGEAGLLKRLEEVYRTGKPYIGIREKKEIPVIGHLQTVYFNSMFKPLLDTNGKVYGLHHTAIDVTEEVSATRELEVSVRDLQTLANAVPQLVWIAAPDGTVTYYNERVAQYAGARQLPDGSWSWESLVFPADAEATVLAWETAVREGSVYEIEHRVKMKEGDYRWHLSRAMPQRDKKSNIRKWFGTATDVHEHREYQEALKANNNDLIRVNNDLDNFIYTASHDLKAPISNIEGLLSILADDYATGKGYNAETQNILDMMRTSVDRFKSTINSLTDVAKLQHESDADVELVSLEKVVNDVVLDLEPQIKAAHATLYIDLAECPRVRFSKKNLRSVLYNLISNAIKFRAQERSPKVEISCKLKDQYHVLTVTDNGLGLDESSVKTLFTMFRRFHDHVEGTGVGLYMVKKITENAGGYIEVDSKEAQGTTFKVYIPL